MIEYDMADDVNRSSICCQICFCKYNRSQRKPVIICSLKHTVCDKCQKDFKNRTCPFCRKSIEESQIVINIKYLPSSQVELRSAQRNKQKQNQSQKQKKQHKQKKQEIYKPQQNQNNEIAQSNRGVKIFFCILITFELVQVFVNLYFYLKGREPNCLDRISNGQQSIRGYILFCLTTWVLAIVLELICVLYFRCCSQFNDKFLNYSLFILILALGAGAVAEIPAIYYIFSFQCQAGIKAKGTIQIIVGLFLSIHILIYFICLCRK